MGNQAKVYFVGAGPGDSDLITVRGMKILQKADYVLYDNLVGKDILEYTKKKENNIYVGKKIGLHSKTQPQINQLLLEYIQKGNIIVRLKGGDPLIFGRLDEEVQFLKKHGVSIEIIPGITSASCAAAELQFSLTHREYGKSVILLSGYSKEYSSSTNLPHYNWDFLAGTPTTLVFYMGFYNLGHICKKLIEHGKPTSTKVAVITNASLSTQKSVVGDLGNIKQLIQSQQLTFPATIIIGDCIQSTQTNVHTGIISSMQKKGIVAIFHGAKILQNSQLPQNFIDSIQEEIENFECNYGFLTEEFHPNYKEAVEELIVSKKVKMLYIWPIFILPGKHLNIDIPKIYEQLKKQYEDTCKIILLDPPDINKDLSLSLKKQLLSQLREYV